MDLDIPINREYLEAYGKPVAFYSDKHDLPRQRQRSGGGDGMTQFGRALHQLNIDIICANAPQAKGRVERANGTLQDRLVEELRLAGISTLETGNAFLPAWWGTSTAALPRRPTATRTCIACSARTMSWMTCWPGGRS